MRILVVEDDPLVSSGIKEGLGLADFTVDLFDRAEHALSQLRAGETFDLAVVDLGLPGMDGHALIECLRRQDHRLPVLILTARDTLEDCVKGLEAGADDYMTKPFRLAELVARVRALIRRSNAITTSKLSCGPLEFDTSSRLVTVSGSELDLTTRERALLEVLMMQCPQVSSKTKLLQTLSGWDKDMTPNAIEVHVFRLRAKLAASGITIRTVRGIGYRLDVPRQD
jgi:DNA-binding response OmpR family regulator